MWMKRFRVLMYDQVNGKHFHFAIFINALNGVLAANRAVKEFPAARIVETRQVPRS